MELNKIQDPETLDTIDITRLIGLLRRNILFLIIVPSLVAIAALILSFLQTPVYSASKLCRCDPIP